MNFTFIAYIFMFMLLPIGFLFGGGKLFELRNYQYGVIALSIILFFLHKKKFIKNSFFSFSEPHQYIKYAVIIASFLAYLSDSLSQYYGFRISGIDFSIFEGMLQNAILGNWGYEDITKAYHFGIHQNWILLLILPFYALFPSPLLLILMGAFIIWFAGLIIIRLAKAFGHNEFIAYFSAIFWWTCPFTVQAFHGIFYPELFYPLFLFSMFVFYVENKRIPFLISIFLFLSVKEDAAIYMLGFCLALLIKRIMNKDKENMVPYKIQFIAFFMCISFLFINFLVVKPYFLNKQNLQEAGYFAAWWGAWGNTPSAILINVLNHPFQAFKTIILSSGWQSLYLPMLLIPLFNLEVFLASAPFLFLYGISISRSSEYATYYPLILWSFALYGLLKNRFVPKGILIGILFIMPLLKPSWLGIEKLNWQEWKFLDTYKEQMDTKQTYCIHVGLWPFLSSRHLKAEPFSNVGKLECIPVFSWEANPYPDNKETLKKLSEKLKTAECIKYQIGSLVEVNSSIKCSELIRNQLF